MKHTTLFTAALLLTNIIVQAQTLDLEKGSDTLFKQKPLKDSCVTNKHRHHTYNAEFRYDDSPERECDENSACEAFDYRPANYMDNYIFNGNIFWDSIAYKGMIYSLKDFRQKAIDGTIRLHQGAEYGDTVWFQHRWIDKDKYSRNYCFEKAGIPGVSYQYYKPKTTDSTKAYTGLAFEYLLYEKVCDDEDKGPAQVRVYGKLGYLTSSNETDPLITNLSVGLTMSLEKNPRRTFFVPYYGAELGGLFMQHHSVGYFMPMAGVQLLAVNGIMIGANGGYVYTPTHLDSWRGYFAQANVDISLW